MTAVTRVEDGDVGELDAMDEATDLRLQMFRDVPEQTRREVAHLRTYFDERFQTVNNQFVERDVRTDKAATASADALAAALQAAKELVGAQGEASAAAAATQNQRGTARSIRRPASGVMRLSSPTWSPRSSTPTPGPLSRGST